VAHAETRSPAVRPARAGGGEPPAPLLVSAKATASMLGISARLLYSLTASGELPAVRIRRMVRYRVADVEAFIARHAPPTGGAA
jgi:excisionase family DNA binding protein